MKELDLNSNALAGEPMSEDDFKEWIEHAEDSPSLSLDEAKERWAALKKKLQKSIA